MVPALSTFAVFPSLAYFDDLLFGYIAVSRSFFMRIAKSLFLFSSLNVTATVILPKNYSVQDYTVRDLCELAHFDWASGRAPFQLKTRERKRGLSGVRMRLNGDWRVRGIGRGRKIRLLGKRRSVFLLALPALSSASSVVFNPSCPAIAHQEHFA